MNEIYPQLMLITASCGLFLSLSLSSASIFSANKNTVHRNKQTNKKGKNTFVSKPLRSDTRGD